MRSIDIQPACAYLPEACRRVSQRVLRLKTAARHLLADRAARPATPSPGEGVQVEDITTRFFSGEILAFNHEACGKNYKGGFSLWDVSDPTKPKRLATGIGDRTVDGSRRAIRDANETHSVFIWDAGDRAYLVAQDEWESSDVDIFDITNPRHPVLIAEYDLNALFGVSQPELGLTDSFLHDMVVKEIGGRFIMLASYWDGGYVQLDVTDPTNPMLLAQSEYAAFDPLFPTVSPPEGNGHQAEFTMDNRFVIGTDEDFDPYRFSVNTDDGGQSWAKAATQTTADEADAITGTTVFVGRGCIGDEAVPSPESLGLAVADGPYIAVVERGLCTFEEKLGNIETAGGYSPVIIFNRQGADACNAVLSPFIEFAELPVVLTTGEGGFGLFDLDAEFDLDAGCNRTEPVRDVGDWHRQRHRYGGRSRLRRLGLRPSVRCCHDGGPRPVHHSRSRGPRLRGRIR